jgi:primary-amine oxidase
MHRFLPHNYLLGDPSRSVHHQVKVEYSNEGVQNILQYGENPSGTLDLADTVPKLWSYKGDIAVRKFPFDPANPFEDTDSIV